MAPIQQSFLTVGPWHGWRLGRSKRKPHISRLHLTMYILPKQTTSKQVEPMKLSGTFTVCYGDNQHDFIGVQTNEAGHFRKITKTLNPSLTKDTSGTSHPWFSLRRSRRPGPGAVETGGSPSMAFGCGAMHLGDAFNGWDSGWGPVIRPVTLWSFNINGKTHYK